MANDKVASKVGICVAMGSHRKATAGTVTMNQQCKALDRCVAVDGAVWHARFDGAVCGTPRRGGRVEWVKLSPAVHAL